MRALAAFIEDNPALFRQEELILDVTELIAGVMEQAGVTACDIAEKLNKPLSVIERQVAGDDELTLRTASDILGSMGFRMCITAGSIR
jgi:hypothetical protein